VGGKGFCCPNFGGYFILYTLDAMINNIKLKVLTYKKAKMLSLALFTSIFLALLSSTLTKDFCAPPVAYRQ